MSPTLVNPFLNRTAIRDPNAFVGRSSELKRVFNRIGGGQPQSVSIVGDPRIGKSSFLRSIMARRTTALPKPDGYLFAYLDMQSRLRWTPEMFFGRLVEEIAATPEPGFDCPTPSYDGLEQFARSLQTNGRTLVILVDEFHVLMRDEQHDAPLPVEFFNYLRSLANSYSVSLIVTSHVDLYTLSADHRLSGSPLFNILHKLHLGPFSATESRDLIETQSALHGCPLAADREWILAHAGHHPLYLQIACSTAFEWRAEHGHEVSLDARIVGRRFAEEATPHFESTWRLLLSGEQEVIGRVARGHALGEEQLPVADTLVQRGYLRHHAGQPKVFSESFRRFVLRQHSDVGAISSGEIMLPLLKPSTTPNGQATPIRLFLSYASEDRAHVKELYQTLEQAGMQPWMDDEDLIVGDAWARKIDEAIATTDFFVACLSTRSVDKKGVLQGELTRAIDRWYGRGAPDNFLIPVLLEECPLPPALAHLQKVDLWHDDGWARLRRGIERVVARRHNQDGDKSHPPEQPTAPGITPLPSPLSPPTTGFVGRVRAFLAAHGTGLGVVLLTAGVLLLLGGLSGNALSQLIGLVGFERAKTWNIILRILEVITLVSGGLLVCVGLLRARTRWQGFSGALLLATIVLLLATITVPAPSAFALAYGRYLDNQSAAWRSLLMRSFDPDTSGIRDIQTDRRVQAWTTAQTAVGVLASTNYDKTKVPVDLPLTFRFLEKVRLGPPENGWGYFDKNANAITEITAWVTLAEIGSLRAKLWSSSERLEMQQRVEREVSALLQRQARNGGFSPIADIRDGNVRTYSTVTALWALAEALESEVDNPEVIAGARRGMDWLLESRDRELGWVPNPGRRYQTEEFPGLTAQALVVLDLLTRQLKDRGDDPRLVDAKRRFTESTFSGATIAGNARVPDSDVHIDTDGEGLILEGTSFLWYPWARAAFAVLAHDQTLPAATRERAARQLAALTLRTDELTRYLERGLPYQLAENLLSIQLVNRYAQR